MTNDFVHLHVHSDFSLLDGAASVKQLVAKAKELGQTALALTDHGNMFGVISFYKACTEQGIKPIIGCEFYVAPESRFEKKEALNGKRYYHLILLAKNETGYKNLMLLCSKGYTEGMYYKPRIDDELLEKYADGLICLSACLAGELPVLLLNGETEKAEAHVRKYRKIFGNENYFIEIQNHGLKEEKKSRRSFNRNGTETRRSAGRYERHSLCGKKGLYCTGYFDVHRYEKAACRNQ